MSDTINKLKIELDHVGGRGKVWLNGEELHGVGKVTIRSARDEFTSATIELMTSVEIEGGIQQFETNIVVSATEEAG